MMDEIRKLQEQLRQTQKAPTKARFLESTTVDIVQSLQTMNLLDFIRSMDGKEIMTRESLQQEVVRELRRHNGRLTISEIPPLLNVDYDRVFEACNALKSKSIFVAEGTLISDDYIRQMAVEIQEVLLEMGVLTLSDLVVRFQVPFHIIQKSVEKHLGKIIQAKLQGDTLVTETHGDEMKALIRGTFMGITVPTNIVTQIVPRLNIAENLLMPIVEHLISDGKLKGKISKGLYSPLSFSKGQTDALESFYAQNGFVTFEHVKKLGLGGGDMQGFLQQRLKEELIFLDTLAVGKSTLESLSANLEESLADEGYALLSDFHTMPLTDDDYAVLFSNLPFLAPATKSDELQLVVLRETLDESKHTQSCPLTNNERKEPLTLRRQSLCFANVGSLHSSAYAHSLLTPNSAVERTQDRLGVSRSVLEDTQTLNVSSEPLVKESKKKKGGSTSTANLNPHAILLASLPFHTAYATSTTDKQPFTAQSLLTLPEYYGSLTPLSYAFMDALQPEAPEAKLVKTHKSFKNAVPSDHFFVSVLTVERLLAVCESELRLRMWQRRDEVWGGKAPSPEAPKEADDDEEWEDDAPKKGKRGKGGKAKKGKKQTPEEDDEAAALRATPFGVFLSILPLDDIQHLIQENASNSDLFVEQQKQLKLAAIHKSNELNDDLVVPLSFRLLPVLFHAFLALRTQQNVEKRASSKVERKELEEAFKDEWIVLNTSVNGVERLFDKEEENDESDDEEKQKGKRSKKAKKDKKKESLKGTVAKAVLRSFGLDCATTLVRIAANDASLTLPTLSQTNAEEHIQTLKTIINQMPQSPVIPLFQSLFTAIQTASHSPSASLSTFIDGISQIATEECLVIPAVQKRAEKALLSKQQTVFSTEMRASPIVTDSTPDAKLISLIVELIGVKFFGVLLPTLPVRSYPAIITHLSNNTKELATQAHAAVVPPILNALTLTHNAFIDVLAAQEQLDKEEEPDRAPLVSALTSYSSQMDSLRKMLMDEA
ncbi:putative E3 UFM1-protein ligase 1 like protein [Blattamonas nauphoetae]|uniref:E3 UFM1-protein ligase 1 like protein n=1 Tax=Blattamonas nauphoetae TaxID=2049346 RepID=A0ABQ9XE29_9EUKA|nr:putative E3 UFM1-protein ligase 1 like protein [Blattamonas nauphoetae]